MDKIKNRISSIDLRCHVLVSCLLRLLLVFYGIYHDASFAVPYTDVDYKVFTDASRHVLNGSSPYDRHTYRYSPIVAFLMVPNVLIHHIFGKLLFCLVDILVALLIYAITKQSVINYESKSIQLNTMVLPDDNVVKDEKSARQKASVALIAWLYNPMTIAISTRGNCDSLAGLLVLSTLYCMECKNYYFLAGIIHGVSIHFRLYPLAYSLTMFMYLSSYSYYSATKVDRNSSGKLAENKIKTISKISREKRTIFKMRYLLYIWPNFNQLKLIVGCLTSLISLIGLFYCLYGYKFLYETYIFHLIRKDTRHNFSLYFYLQYLTAWIKNIGLWQKVLVVLPQVVLLLVFSVYYGLNRFTFNFGILLQTITMVTYNTVLTSQYFTWIMAILPLCLWQIRMSLSYSVKLLVIWYAAQGAWLLPAYLLEFCGRNTFLFIWIQSISLFCANVAILGRLIKYHMINHHKIE